MSASLDLELMRRSMLLEKDPAYAASNRNGEARAALERAVELDSSLAEAWHELAARGLLDGDAPAADAAYIEQWRHFGPWLDPLKIALDGLLDRYPRAR